MKIVVLFLLMTSLFACRGKEIKENRENNKAQIIINCSEVQGKFRHSELYNNNSLLRVPRKEVTDKYLKSFGKTKIMRCWLTLNECWDYETGTFNFDYPVGWGFNLWSSYYDYLGRFSDISEEILLNVRGDQDLVLKGKISIEEWSDVCEKAIKHYKLKFPKIKYIEALNEYDGEGFGGISNDQYYVFYKEFYKIVNRINIELKPEIPLLIGGPCIMGGSLDDNSKGTKREKMLAFLDNYKKDTFHNKKLDFISYHQYNDTKADPSTALHHEVLIDSWLKERSLSSNLPIFINEMGCFPGSKKRGCMEEDQFLTACNIASLMYYYDQQKDMYGFHWVMQHKTNERKNQILDDLRWTPYGISMLMMKMHKDIKIKATSNGIKKGQGIYAQASMDDSTVILQTWNYQWTSADTVETEIVFSSIPEAFNNRPVILTQYLLDDLNNNFLNSESYYWKSDAKEDITVFKTDTIKDINKLKTILSLKPNSMAVIKLSIVQQ